MEESMGKRIIRDYDEHGIACEQELLEGEITRYFSAADRRYGFVELDNGTSFFFHLNNRSTMDGYGVGKLRFIPRFLQRHERSLPTPKVGDRILFVLGKDRRDRTSVREWTYVSEYDEALQACERYKELELERLECDPNFRCMQSVHLTGRPALTPTQVYKGTKQQFNDKYPLHAFNKFESLDPLLTRESGDTVYLRWFERETLEGWEFLNGDPRTTKLKLTRSQALGILWACTRSVDQDKWEVYWHSNSRRLTYVIDDTHPLIAVGTSQGDVRTIRFVETTDNLETTFHSKQSAFEKLWMAGNKRDMQIPVR